MPTVSAPTAMKSPTSHPPGCSTQWLKKASEKPSTMPIAVTDPFRNVESIAGGRLVGLLAVHRFACRHPRSGPLTLTRLVARSLSLIQTVSRKRGKRECGAGRGPKPRLPPQL